MKMKLDIEESIHEPRFKGFSKIPNQDYLLLKYGGINEAEFILFQVSKTVSTDWDANHYKTYTTFDKNDLIEQMGLLGWTESKSKRLFRSLKKKSIFNLVDPKRNKYRNCSFLLQE